MTNKTKKKITVVQKTISSLVRKSSAVASKDHQAVVTELDLKQS